MHRTLRCHYVNHPPANLSPNLFPAGNWWWESHPALFLLPTSWSTLCVYIFFGEIIGRTIIIILFFFFLRSGRKIKDNISKVVLAVLSAVLSNRTGLTGQLRNIKTFLTFSLFFLFIPFCWESGIHFDNYNGGKSLLFNEPSAPFTTKHISIRVKISFANGLKFRRETEEKERSLLFLFIPTFIQSPS